MSLVNFLITNKPEDIALEEMILVLRHLALEGDAKTSVYLLTKDEDEKEVKVLLATLSSANPQHSMELPISGEVVQFITEGPGKVHAIGNIELDEDEFGDMEEDSEDDEENEFVSEEEDDDEPQPEPVKEVKKPQPKKEEKKPQPKKETKVEEKKPQQGKPQQGKPQQGKQQQGKPQQGKQQGKQQQQHGKKHGKKGK
ncbi:Nucleoplasmin-like domain-containing protein [Entamoeba marina]